MATSKEQEMIKVAGKWKRAVEVESALLRARTEILLIMTDELDNDIDCLFEELKECDANIEKATNLISKIREREAGKINAETGGSK